MESGPRLVGGDVALDLVNTIDDGVDHLAADADPWLDHVGLGGHADAARARDVRAVLNAALRPFAEGAVGDLGPLLALERDGLAAARLRPGGLEFDDPLAAIVHSAVELVTHGRLDRLKTCGNCDWIFLDVSRNGSRRWCSMEACGTEVKIRRLTERRRAAR